MAEIVTVALVAVAVGGILVMLARRAVASTAAEEADDRAASTRSYGDLAARAREVHAQTTPPGASAVTPPVLRVRANQEVVQDTVALVRRPTIARVERLEVRRVGGGRAEVVLTIEVDGDAS